jgi:hypothetical protein
MAASIADRLADVHPKMLRAEGESDRKKLVEDLRPVIGRLVERAIALAGLTKQEAAFAMGYSDQGAVSRWCSGVERPQFDKLFVVKGFKLAWLLAIAEDSKEIEVETTIKVRRIA